MASSLGIIDLEGVRQQLEMKKKEELLNRHPYKIYLGKDGKYHSYLPALNKYGRKAIKCGTQEEIEKIVIDYWRQEEENPTVEDIFYEWIDKKMERGDISQSTKDRYVRQFKECFAEFGNRRIKSITESDIEDFILDTIPKCNLTVKGWGNMRTLLYGIFKRAKKKNYVSFSITDVVKDCEISRKSFRRTRKEDEELVFMESEIPKVMEVLNSNLDLINLGIMLLFKTGMRIGELAALKPSNISGNIVMVRATEISYENEDGERVFEIRDFPKTEAGIRDIVMLQKDAWILKRIKMLNPFGEYLFERNGKRILTYMFRARLATVCKHAGVVSKSPNKIRKTYGSILIDSGVDESVVISQMGHTDIRTTRGHYYRNRKNILEMEHEMQKVQNL